ncbi:TPA: hypothetical protein PPN70_004053 [Serratia rubidaea]|nr:hypothetical protein [Serratia rubidaea]HDJ1447191.1 hypothetical protein [Serratia rubidaea]HDJ1463282.1 hypothetical protein [Serratia rubidaea]HDJ2773024.1 hypothetical protein [Serratia rubidaea]
MNLHGIVSRAIGVVNPFVEAQIYRSLGAEKQADYSRSPAYAEPVTMMVQKQAVTQGDIRHLDNLNIQGVFTSIYTNGNWCGVNRPKEQGGDKFVIGSDTWLVVAVPENWPDWTRVVACLQK